MATDNSEQLKKIDEKLEQLKARRQAILNREKEKQRKERTRRLIENGAIAEKYLNCEKLDPLEFEKLMQKIVCISDVKIVIEDK